MQYNDKIISFQKVNIDPLRKKKGQKSIVLVGGCFDILHVGHIRFLSSAKIQNSILVVLLEHDEKVKKLKGTTRPYFTQQERAEMLSALSCVDFVILLPQKTTDTDYETIIATIRPDYIALTENDPLLEKKQSHAKKMNAQIKIIPHIKTSSTSRVAKLLGIE